VSNAAALSLNFFTDFTDDVLELRAAESLDHDDDDEDAA
jgi:hypothetical protein